MLYEKIELEPDEKMIKVIRKHWFLLVLITLGSLLLTFLPLIIFYAIANVFENAGMTLGNPEELTPFFVFLFSMWVLINWMLFAYNWTDHYLDTWSITDRRIVKIDQVGFFNRQIGSFRLEKLQDVNTEVKGIIPTFLNFGTVMAQTASGSQDAEFRADSLPNPQEIKSIILRAADARMKIHTKSNDLV